MFVAASVKTHPRNGQICWTVSDLAAHARTAFTITVRALPGATGRLTNTVAISGPEIDPRTESAAVQVTARPQPPTAVTG